jgi:hypothetical protein
MKDYGNVKAWLGAGALLCTLCGPAAAQVLDGPDPSYGPRERYQDELARPSELDGLELGRDAPIFNSEDVGVPRSRRGTFEIEGPPISPSLPILPVDPD